MFVKTLALAAAVGSAVAQRPTNTSICDYYTTALLKENTAANQMTLLTLLVNTAVIGNYTQPNMNAVPGILTPGMVNGTAVNLAPYFSGALASTNTGKDMGVSVNFLDGGGATPLMNNTAANDESSNQYTLLTHLYQYFGALTGCSMQGTEDYPAYEGEASQYDVHKYMGLGLAEVTYFIQQVGLSATSFGVTTEDATAVGTSLMNAFGYRCAPPTTIIPSQGAQLQSICIDSTCPEAMNSTCSSYETVVEPMNATTTTNGSTSTPSSTDSPVATVSKAAAASLTFSFAAVAGGLAAAFL